MFLKFFKFFLLAERLRRGTKLGFCLNFIGIGKSGFLQKFLSFSRVFTLFYKFFRFYSKFREKRREQKLFRQKAGNVAKTGAISTKIASGVKLTNK